MKLILRLLTILGLRGPDLTPAQRREQHCAKGIHRYRGGFLWLSCQQPNPRNDAAADLTMSGSHCMDCGKWDCETDGMDGGFAAAQKRRSA